MSPRILVIDIETSPDVSVHFGRFNQNIGLAQTLVRGGTICWAAKWVGEKKVEFRSDWRDGHAVVVERAHALLDEADAVIHFNGKSFDEKHLNREFALAGMAPPSPFRPIDLVLTARRRFRFTSNKLDNLLAEFDLTRKLDTGGIELWVESVEHIAQIAGIDEAATVKAQRLMERYNVQDVRSTEQLYHRIRPWINDHPHMGLFSDTEVEQHVCSVCGSGAVQRRGYTYTQLGRYARYWCKESDCGAWSRGKKADGTAGLRAVA